MLEIVARFEFRPERACEFNDNCSQFVEQRYDSVEELIADCEAFKEAIIDVTALVNSQVITLANQPIE